MLLPHLNKCIIHTILISGMAGGGTRARLTEPDPECFNHTN